MGVRYRLVEWWHAIVLGLVQGLTEFLPISSSAHLRVASDLLGIGDVGAAFTAITQIGTELAVVLIYRQKIAKIIRAWFGALPLGPWKGTVPRTDPDARLGTYVILGSIPIVVLGLAFEGAIDYAFRHLMVTAAMLALFGLLLGAADKYSRRERELESMTARDALFFGLAQSLALIPGVSRSGGTITAGLFLGYTRKAAADYSFLLAIPAVLGSGFYKLFKDGLTGNSPVTLPLTLLATGVAFAVAYVVILWFLRIITTRSYAPFVIYRLVLAGLIVLGTLSGVLTALPA